MRSLLSILKSCKWIYANTTWWSMIWSNPRNFLMFQLVLFFACACRANHWWQTASFWSICSGKMAFNSSICLGRLWKVLEYTIIKLCLNTGMAQWWEHSPPISVARVRLLVLVSRTRTNNRLNPHIMRVEFVVGSRRCYERFFSGYSGFPLFSKTNISKFQFDLQSPRFDWYYDKVVCLLFCFVVCFNRALRNPLAFYNRTWIRTWISLCTYNIVYMYESVLMFLRINDLSFLIICRPFICSWGLLCQIAWQVWVRTVYVFLLFITMTLFVISSSLVVGFSPWNTR